MKTYSYGLVRFLQAKKLKSKECINAFLLSEGITTFTAKQEGRCSAYIESNWTKFASFVDRGMKDGVLQGTPVKLNHHFDELRERKAVVAREFEAANLTESEKELIKFIRDNGIQAIQSFLMKNNIKPEKKETGYTSKLLQWRPLIKQAIQHNFSPL